MADTPQPTITVSMARKIKLGNYESADCFVSMSGVTAGMTAEEMAPLLNTAEVAWGEVRAALADEIARTRSAK